MSKNKKLVSLKKAIQSDQLCIVFSVLPATVNPLSKLFSTSKKPPFQTTNTAIDNNPMAMPLFFRIIASVLKLKCKKLNHE